MVLAPIRSLVEFSIAYYSLIIALISIIYSLLIAMLTSTRDTQAMANGQFKPPNVLIYTGPDDTDQEQYNSLKRALAQVLNLQSYVVYRLHEHKITTHPWIENTALLVLGPHDDTLPQSVQEVFLQYVRGGGKLLGISGSFAIQVIKKQWGEKDKPFPVLAEVGNSVLDEEQSRHLMAICDPYYFEGDYYCRVEDRPMGLVVLYNFGKELS